ncbi:hypothetical protein FPQ18DRAFT_304573 [Pyronema domesticum]|nr:hypothetical protein FPQ18DRAFT_304573 [Pyronema domesticum]
MALYIPKDIQTYRLQRSSPSNPHRCTYNNTSELVASNAFKYLVESLTTQSNPAAYRTIDSFNRKNTSDQDPATKPTSMTFPWKKQPSCPLGDPAIFPLEIFLEIFKYASIGTIAKLRRINQYFNTILIPNLYHRGVSMSTEYPRQRNPVAWAISHFHNVQAIDNLLDYGMSGNTWMDALDGFGGKTSLLHLALRSPGAMGGDFRIVRALLAHGADTNSKDYGYDSPLTIVLQKGYMDVTTIVSLLLECGAKKSIDYGWMDPPLHLAIIRREEDPILYKQVIVMLLDNGAGLGGRSWGRFLPFELAKNSKDTEIMDILRSRGAPER